MAGHVPHGSDGQHDLLPHRGVQAINGLLLQQHLRGTAVWMGQDRAPPSSTDSPWGCQSPSWHPQPLAVVPATQQEGHRLAKGPAAGPCRWLWSIAKDAAPERRSLRSARTPCLAEPSAAPGLCRCPCLSLTAHALTSRISASSGWKNGSVPHREGCVLLLVQTVQTDARNFSFWSASCQPGRGQMDRHCQAGETDGGSVRAPGTF